MRGCHSTTALTSFASRLNLLLAHVRHRPRLEGGCHLCYDGLECATGICPWLPATRWWPPLQAPSDTACAAHIDVSRSSHCTAMAGSAHRVPLLHQAATLVSLVGATQWHNAAGVGEQLFLFALSVVHLAVCALNQERAAAVTLQNKCFSILPANARKGLSQMMSAESRFYDGERSPAVQTASSSLQVPSAVCQRCALPPPAAAKHSGMDKTIALSTSPYLWRAHPVHLCSNLNSIGLLLHQEPGNIRQQCSRDSTFSCRQTVHGHGRLPCIR